MKSNKRPFFRFIKSIVRLFIKKPTFVNEEYISNDPCLYISNHVASSGPTKYELYLPTNFQMMGAHEMCGSLKQRWNYLFKVYFHQKRNVPKWISAVIATIITPFMIMFYKGMQIIPIYNDGRFKKSINIAIETLEKNISLLIFPENSNEGYFDELRGFHGGFWLIAREYHRKTGKDLKIINMYYSKKNKKIIVDEPLSYVELSKELKNHKEASAYFLEKTNNLYKQTLNE